MFNTSAKAVKTIVRPAQRSKAVLSSGFGNAARYFGVLRFYFYAYFSGRRPSERTRMLNKRVQQSGSLGRDRFFDYQTWGGT